MAGIQQYTSSLFVQSGSVAKFESGLEVTESIRVDGVISASGYFDLEGNEITGGVVKEFFAGSGSGVSASNPFSEDIFIPLESGKISASNVTIHTTHSDTFSPNHYAFVKIEDEFKTQQEGSIRNHNIGDLFPGVYRYLVYGAQTGSGGETHQVYTTVFIKGFFNEAPVLNLPTSPTLSIAHDETTGSLILHFTNSFDENNEDAISFFSASKLTPDQTDVNTESSSYVLAMSHSNFSGQNVSNLSILQTGSLNLDTHNGLKPYTNTLFFTASVSNYNIVGGNEVFYQNRSDKITFKITLKDENEVINSGFGIPGVTTENFDLHLEAPPTASIKNIRTEFEDGGFTGNSTGSLTHTLLYDKTESLSSASISELHDRYTSSLIRLSTRANIIQPENYTPTEDHYTKVMIQSGPDDFITGTSTSPVLSFFRFKGGELTASAIDINSIDGTYSTPTESLGFTSFVFTPNFTNNTQSLLVGSYNNVEGGNAGNITYLNRTYRVQHGTNNHYQVFAHPTPSQLIIHDIPNIEISNVVVEVESGSYGSNIGHSNLTSSLLYGYTSSLLSSQTQSLLIDKIATGSEDPSTHPQYSNYISASVVRLRVKAKITEPFGPDHKSINFTLTGSKSDLSEQLSHVFVFNTSSAHHSNSEYSNETKPRLVAHYTSSWVEFNFNDGVYNFTTHLASSSNAGSTIDTISTAVVSMSNYNNVELSDLIYETEHSGLTGSGVNDTNIVTSTTRSILYGHEHSIFGVSSSYHNHPSSSTYASHSLLRMRVRGKITEPFGPATSKLDFNFFARSTIATNAYNINTDAFTINTTSSNVFINNQLVTVFTSSLIGQQINLTNIPSVSHIFTGSAKSSTWFLTGSVDFDDDITNEFEGNGTLSILSSTNSKLNIIDTPSTKFEFTPIEIETFGESNVGLQNPIQANASQVSRSIRFGQTTTDITGSGITDYLTGSTVSRFRTKVTIIEPLGPLHHPSKIQTLFNSGSTFIYGPTQSFSTNSLNIFDSSSNYDSQDRLVVSYTSSFTGSALTATPNHFWKGVINDSSITHEPLGENGDNITTDQNDSLLYFVVTGSDDNPTNIVNITIEVESGSFNTNVGHSNLTSSILYGFTSSLSSSITKSLIDDVVGTDHQFYSDYISQSIVRLRLKAEVNEPFGLSQGTFTATIQTSSETPAGAFDLLPFTPPTFTFSSNTGTPTLENFLGICLGGVNNITASVTEQLDNVISDGTLQVGDTFRLKYSNGTQQDLTISSIEETVNGSLLNKGLTFNENLTTVGGGTSMYQLLSNSDLIQITSFTSSFVEIKIPSGTYTFTSSFTANNNAIELGPQTTAEISMSSVAPTKFEDFHYEMEKHGYAGSGSNDVNMVSSTSRDVLFGDDHFISDGTGSGQKGEYFASHPSASVYASHSVARFRVRGKMIEPFGPGTTNSTVNLKITSSNYSDLTFGNVSITPTTAGTYTSDKELITLFTSSLESQSIQLRSEDFGANNEVDFHVSGNIIHNPISLNNLTVTNPSFGTITVKDTAKTDVKIFTEFETFGHSETPTFITTRTVLYGDPHITNATSASTVWENHPLSASYASHSVTRGRVKVEIIEPIGPLHSKVQFTKQLSGSFGTLTAFTGSSDFENSQSLYLSSNNFKVVYTESFNGRALKLDSSNFGGQESFKFSGSNQTHLNADSENGLLPTILSSVVTVKDTPATIIEDIVYETETFGHSEISSTNTTRSVLYGDPHITNATSESASWINHPSASTYASHSVTRFRIKSKITEPFGYLVHTSSFEETISSSGVYETSSIFNLFSGSLDIENSSVYDAQNRLVTNYTTSFHGHVLSSSINGNASYLFTSGNIIHNPTGENGFTTASGVSSNILVKDTPKVNVSIRCEFEEFGHSASNASDSGVLNTTRSVLYGDPHITNATSESAYWENHPSASIYASHSVTRGRVKVEIIEPLGPLHAKFRFFKVLNNNPVGSTFWKTLTAFTGSSDFEDSQSFYQPDDKFKVVYTSSFDGKIAELSPNNYGGTQDFTFTTTGRQQIGADTENGFNYSETSATLTVEDTPATIIENIIYETETFGYSEIITTNTTRSVLYGDPHITNETSESKIWENHENSGSYASASVTRFRIRTKITEPLGPLHHPTTFEEILSSGVYSTSSVFSFFTGSSDAFDSSSAYNEATQLVTTYTTSFHGHILSSSIGGNASYLFTSGNITHTPTGENGFTTASGVSSNILVKDTAPAQIIINKIEIGSGSAASNDVEFDNNDISPDIIKIIPFGSNTTQGDPALLLDSLEPNSLTRFRILTDIIEPLGYAKYQTNIKYNYQNHNSTAIEGNNLSFATNLPPSDIFDSSSDYDLQDRLVSSYTSSFIGENLTKSSPNFYKFYISDSNIELINTTEPNPLIENDISSRLYFKVDDSEQDPLQINEIAVEVESASLGNLTGYGSNRGYHQLSSSLLYGFTSSLLSNQTESLIENQTTDLNSTLVEKYKSGSIIRFRIRSKITEPYGSTIHTISSSFTSLEFNSTLVKDPIPKRIDVEFTLNHNGTAADFGQGGSSNDFATDPVIHSGSIDLGGLSSDFTGNRTLRLVSMSMKGDLDTGGSTQVETISATNGLKIGNQTIINTATDFLQNVDSNTQTQDYSIILPENLQPDNVNGFNSSNINMNSNVTNSIEMVNGIVDVSASFTGKVLHSTYPFILSCSFEYDTFSFQDEFLGNLFSPTFSFGENQPSPIGDNIQGQVISSSNFETGFSDGLPRIVSRYTSSWVELQIPTGSFKFLSTFASASNSPFISLFDSANSQSAEVTMSNTLPTQLVDLSYETEKHGHAGSGSNDSNIVTDTVRKVLYGDVHVTNATSASTVWENHPLSASYASHSVTRFRIKGKVIEPFGPATSTQTITYQSINEGNITTHGSSLSVNTLNPGANVISNIEFNNNNQRITTFTQSIFTDNINFTLNNPSNTPSLESTYIVSGSVGYTVNNLDNPFPGSNTLNIDTPTTTSVKVFDTAAPQITVTKIETETFGESNEGVSNNNESTPGIISRSIFNGNTTLSTGSGIDNLFTSSVVTKFRTLVDVIEPLGYTHESTAIILEHNPKGANSNTTITGPLQIFSTNSADIFDSSSDYDLQDRLVSSYTSSFTGSKLGTSLGLNNEHGYWEATTQSIIYTPTDGTNISTTVTDSELYYVVSKSFSTIDVPTVTDLKVEVELVSSGSNQFGNERITNLLHGKSSTETDQTVNATYNNDSKNQLVMARVMARIEEPPQTIHNALEIIVGGHSTTNTISFATNSIDTSSSDITPATAFEGLIGIYTSSYFPLLLNADGNTNSSPTENAERITYEISASLGDNPLSIQTSITPDNIILSDLSHSFVHVTGAFSSSTLITANSNSSDNKSISSSDFGSYYVYSGNESTTFGTTFVKFSPPTLDTTEPPLTSISNLIFPTHLDITYTLTDNITDNAVANANPSDGAATIVLNIEDFQDLTNVDKTTLTTKVTDFKEGAGLDSITSDIFIIPAQPQVMEGSNWNKSFTNHSSLGIGVSNLYVASLPKGLTHYETNESTDAGTTVSNIFITSKSDGSGNNFEIILTTPSNYTGDYGDSTRAYGYGDTGSLVVIVNGDSNNPACNVSLEADFNSGLKHGDQVMSNYDNGTWNNGTTNLFIGDSTIGTLTLNKVSPFNKVSQSIFYNGVNYPNGYQAWNATLTIDSKIRDGYNKIDFQHRIFPGVTHSLNTIEWYYDNGLVNPIIDTTKTLVPSVFASATHSLSGISYFVKDAPFSASINNVFLNIANETYRDKASALAKIERVNASNPIEISSPDGSPTNQNTLDFHLSQTGLNGLVLSNGGFVPSKTATGSIQNIGIKGTDTSTIGNNNGKGELREAIISIAVRDNYNSSNSWKFNSHTFPIGRFINSRGTTSTDLIEHFNHETYRLLHSIMTNTFIEGITNFSSLTASNFDPTTNIYSIPELQQILGGTLKYPQSLDYNLYGSTTIQYPSNHNYVQNFDVNHPVRYYYRAFKFDFTNNSTVAAAGFSQTKTNANKFMVKVTYKAASGVGLNTFVAPLGDETFGSETTYTNGETNKITMYIRLPGDVTTGGAQTSADPGTNWGVINDSNLNTGLSIPPNSTIWGGLDPQGNSNSGATLNTNTISIPVLLTSGWKLSKTDGVILLKIAIHNSFTGVIEKIEFEGR